MTYIYQGAEFTEEQVAQAATNLGITVEEYVNKYKLTVKDDAVGKTTTMGQGAPVEGMLAPAELSQPSSFSDLDLTSVETAKSETAADTFAQRQNTTLESMVSAAGRGFATAGKGLASIPEQVAFLAMEAYDPSKSGDERLQRRKALASTRFGIAAPTSEEFGKAADFFSGGIKEFENQDILSAIQNGDYTEAAEMAVVGAAESAPSLLAAYTGIGGIALFGGSIVGNKFDEELEANPEQHLGLLAANSVATGVNEMAFEMVTKKLLFGAGFLKQKGLATEASEFLRKGFASAYLKFTGKTLGEAGSESATEGMNMLIDKFTLGKEFTTKEVVHRLF